MVEYLVNKTIDLETIIDLLYRSEYLPIKDMKDVSRLEKMFRNANLILWAWDQDKLVGIAESLTDYSYCCYLSDLCVDKEYRGLNIGKELINLTKKEVGEECKLILHSSKSAIGFYEAIGMKKIDDAFIIQREY